MKKIIFLLITVYTLAACNKGNDNTPEATLEVNPAAAIGFSAGAAESFEITVTTNRPSWDAVSSQSWCTVTKGNGKFTVTAVANTSTSSPAPAVITVTAGTAKPVVINVTQAGVGAKLSVTPITPVSFANTGGTSGAIAVTTNQPSWNVVSNQTWCTVNKSGNAFTVTASAHTGVESRNASVTVSAGNAANVTIDVTQTGVAADDPNLTKVLTLLRHTIYVKQQFDLGNKPSYITNSSGSTIATVHYAGNGALNEVYSNSTGLSALFMISHPLFISGYSRDRAWDNGITGLAYGTYDYKADPAKAVGLFQNAVAQGNTFNTIGDLKRLSNNTAITEALFNSIKYPSGGHYRVIVFGKTASGMLIGKYVGYSTDGKTCNYWCIDPESPTFGQPASKSTPDN